MSWKKSIVCLLLALFITHEASAWPRWRRPRSFRGFASSYGQVYDDQYLKLETSSAVYDWEEIAKHGPGSDSQSAFSKGFCAKLAERGIPALLDFVGIEDVRLINTPFAVLVGIVYGYLPLMVFPIFVSLEKLDKSLLEVSSDLGAPPIRTFLQVTLPLSMPGVATGCMLVFILLMGEFLIPAILGGGKVFFIGNALVDLFLQSRNWPFGSAVAVALVVIMRVTVSLYMRATLRAGTGRDESLM